MPKRIPIKVAKEVAKQYDLKQVILLAWDGKLTHVVTFGKTVEDCDQAARGGNMIKQSLGWPEELCNEEPSRVKNLKARIRELEEMQDEIQNILPGLKNRITCYHKGTNGRPRLSMKVELKMLEDIKQELERIKPEEP